MLTDHLGSVRDLLTLDGNHLADSHVSYDSFGNVTSTPGGTSILFGYTGRPVDGATGLQNNLHRWYDPAVGRWLSEDPIGFGGGDANLYRYVGNESTGYVDPEGAAKKKPWTHRFPFAAGGALGDFGGWIHNWKHSKTIKKANDIGDEIHEREAAMKSDPIKSLESRLGSLCEENKRARAEFREDATNAANISNEVLAGGLMGGFLRPSGWGAFGWGRRPSAQQTVVLGLDKHLDSFARAHNGK